MEPEGSLPPSQEPSTGPYPEPDRSNPHHPILSVYSVLYSEIALSGKPFGIGHMYMYTFFA
jgi:hypothetical protein